MAVVEHFLSFPAPPASSAAAVGGGGGGLPSSISPFHSLSFSLSSAPDREKYEKCPASPSERQPAQRNEKEREKKEQWWRVERVVVIIITLRDVPAVLLVV